MYSSNPYDFIALGIGIIIFYLILIVGVFVLYALYTKTIIEMMAYVRPSNRLTGVGNIILNTIPVFNIVYGFIVYPKICDSVRQEYNELGLTPDGDFGKALAVTMQALSVTMIIPILNILSSIAILIIWIVLWVKFNNYNLELKKHNASNFGGKTSISASTDILD